MEFLSYNGGYGVRDHMHIETFKRTLGWAINKWLQLIIDIKTVIPLKNKAVFI